MMKQDDWIKQLSDKLADHQATVPDDLWAGIEVRLDGGAPQRRPVLSWRRWLAAAAAVLLLAGGSLVLWEKSSFRGESQAESQRVADAMSGMIEERKAETMKTAEPDAVVPDNTEEERMEAQQLVAQNHTQGPCATEPQEEPKREVSTERQKEPKGEQPKGEEPATAHAVSTEDAVAQSLPRPRDPFAAVVETKHDRRRLTASLYAGNGLENQQSTNGVQMSTAMAQKYNELSALSSSRSDAPIWLANFEEREHHERPFTVGLQLRYPLTERLSLSSGVVYTRLKSTFSKLMKGNEVEQQQQLQYVGVPLELQYRLLQLGRLSVYASAGGQLDWNVRASMSVNGLQADIDRDRPQWSLSGGLGLAYRLMPHVGLFVEPSVNHYLDNHSAVSNYFKDKPTNLSLQLGVQLNVGNK